MRIIAGAKGGLLLKFPKSALVRPATEKVRGAIFNILGDIENHILLDLFAGSGSLGFEGLSRGAGQCVFVDTLDQSIKILKTNAQKLDFLPQCLIIKGLIPSVLRQIKKQINRQSAYSANDYAQKTLEHKLLFYFSHQLIYHL